jgi:hypothetical protein
VPSDGCSTNIGDEAVTAARFRDYETMLAGNLTERAPKLGHVLVEIVLLDDDVRPDGREQRALVDRLARVLDETQQRFECLRLETYEVAVAAEQHSA